MKYFFTFLIFTTLLLPLSCSKKNEALSDVLPQGMKTKPCDIQQNNLFDYIYIYNNEKALLLNNENKRFMYFTETLAPGQTPESWYAAFYQVKAEEAGNIGSAGLSYYFAQGELNVLPQEGATFYTKTQVVDGKKVELAGLLCALSEDETQLVFSATNNMVPKSELIKNAKVYKRAFGGEVRKHLEEKIIQDTTQKIRKTKEGSKIERVESGTTSP